MNYVERSVRLVAKDAKSRLKQGFWEKCKNSIGSKIEEAAIYGVNRNKAEQYYTTKLSNKLLGREKEDEFYDRVKQLLIREGEVCDAIGRLTDKAYFESLGYEERQRYTLKLSEMYLAALKRFRTERDVESSRMFAG